MTKATDPAYPVTKRTYRADGTIREEITTSGMDIRTRIAMEFEAAMLASPELMKVATSADILGDTFPERMAVLAIRYTDALIEQLNREEGK